MDALSDKPDASLGEDARMKVEDRLRQLEGGAMRGAAGTNA